MTKESSQSRVAVLIGATGLVGGACLQVLLEDPRYSKVVAVVRRDLGVRHSKLEQRVIEFDRIFSFADAFMGDDFFCSLGTTIKKAGSESEFFRVDFGYASKAAQIAARNGMRRIMLVSSVGADPGSSNFYLRTKGQLESEILRLPFAQKHIFRPSLLTGKREESRPLERLACLAAGAVGFAFVGKLTRLKPVKARTVARAMVQAALADLPDGTYLHEGRDITDLSLDLLGT